MNYTHSKLRKDFEEFWKTKAHKEVSPAPLVLINDPTTLFNSSGMQQLIPFLQGERHAQGNKLFNIQPCFRAVDIDEVGDNRHTTFFEMMGNWSLGDYFKKEQLTWFWEFLMQIGFKGREDKLHVTVFEGNSEVPKDQESYDIWKQIGIAEDHIHFYGAGKNWWSRSGPPDKMPAGEIGGPDSEVFYDFGEGLKLHENSPYKDQKCHPNCECGRFLEIGNSVFIQYKKTDTGRLEELPQKNVDFGGGLERILAALQDKADVFETELFVPIIRTIESLTNTTYFEHPSHFQVISDHLKGAVFMIGQGVYPSNKEQGYILRRLLRRAALKIHQLGVVINQSISFEPTVSAILAMYEKVYFDKEQKPDQIAQIILEEIVKFSRSIEHGIQEMKKVKEFTGKTAFDFYQNYGFPIEVLEEMLKDQNIHINHDEFHNEFEKHRELSRSASAGKFKGGLADHSEQVVKYHTATHLIHQALFDVLGNDIRQEGSNITGEKLRFDFSTSKQPTKEDMKRVQTIVQDKIDENLPMTFVLMPRDEAFKIGARSFFKEKYPEQVKIYYIGKDLKSAYSKEFCGGPHVTNTKEVGKIVIYKFEKIGSNLYRIYAK